MGWAGLLEVRSGGSVFVYPKLHREGIEGEGRETKQNIVFFFGGLTLLVGWHSAGLAAKEGK